MKLIKRNGVKYLDKDNQIELKAITLAHKPLIIYVVTALMITTSMIYFYLAYEDYQQLLQSSPSSASADDIQSTRNEMVFFLVVAISYIPVSIWMLKVKHSSKIPYLIAIIGSAALIVFYMLTRVIDIPFIGLQTDVGTIDIATKIIQAAIISVSSFLITSMILRRKRLGNTMDKRKDSKGIL